MTRATARQVTENHAEILRGRFKVGRRIQRWEIELFAVWYGFHLVECPADGGEQEFDEVTVNIGDEAEELVWQFRVVEPGRNPLDIATYFSVENVEEDLIGEAVKYYLEVRDRDDVESIQN
jgi:hypothetical protein